MNRFQSSNNIQPNIKNKVIIVDQYVDMCYWDHQFEKEKQMENLLGQMKRSWSLEEKAEDEPEYEEPCEAHAIRKNAISSLFDLE